MNIASYLQGSRLTLCLSGELDHHEARQTMEGISRRLDSFLPKECLLDFSEVSFMDSSGIAVVINAKRSMEELSGRLRLTGLKSQPLKVLRAAGIDKMVVIE